MILTTVQVYSQAKRDIILIEHEIIRILTFQFDVDLPHPYLLNFARCVAVLVSKLSMIGSLSTQIPFRMMNLSSHCVQLALNMINESLLSAEWLTLSASALSCAAIKISLQFIHAEALTDQLTVDSAQVWTSEKKWWKAFGVNDDDLQSATSALLSVAC